MRSTLIALYAVVCSLGAPHAAPAQAPPPPPATEERDPLFVRRDAVWAAGFVLGTLLLAPVDVEIAEAVQDSLYQRNPWIRNTATGFELIGFPGATLVTGGMYALGRVAGRPVLADIGLHSTEAVVLAELFTFAAKSLAGRARPYMGIDDPFDFDFGRGLTSDDYQSFPSGHTTAAFATAASLTAEIGRHWPEAEVLSGAALFGAATMVGAARMYQNKHWASDVMAGAAVGTFSGWKVVRYAHANPDNRLDRWLLGFLVAPVGGGRVALVWTVPARRTPAPPPGVIVASPVR